MRTSNGYSEGSERLPSRREERTESKLIPNPYFNRSAIYDEQYFFGRGAELSKIYSLVLQGQLVAVLGERRIGKSSILKALSFEKHLLQFGISEDRRFIFVDGQYFAKDSEQDFLAVLLELISEETGVSSLEPERQSLARAAKQLASQANPLWPVIVLDEIDVLTGNENISPDFFAYLRAWSQDFRVPFVIAIREGSFENLLKTKGPGSPFWNVFTSIYVGPLDEPAALELIRTPADRLGVPFNEEELQWILKLGGRHPFFLQMACYYMFEMMMSENVKGQNFSMVVQDFRREATPHLDYLLGQLPEPELDALVRYALNLTPPKKRIQDELVRKGFLIQEGEEVRVFSMVLGEMIQSQPVITSKQSLAEKIQGTLLDYERVGLLRPLR
jgi:hypothetical protein